LKAAEPDLKTFVRSPFGSNVGHDAMARIRPVAGSTATAAPACPLSRRPSSAARCAFDRSVRMTSLPRTVCPVVWSTSVSRPPVRLSAAPVR
jgi:hypothetical protein